MPPSSSKAPPETKLAVRDLSFYYGDFLAVKGVSMDVPKNKVTALIGPSGCGKSTLLRCFNRMHDIYKGNRYEGSIEMQPEGVNILSPKVDPIELRLQVSMVFQKPNPFPKSIYDNVAYGLRLKGIRKKTELDEGVERALRQGALWEEAKDRLHEPATALSGGQQQRLCIARAIAPGPEVILFDEPTSALDPIATGKIEELVHQLEGSVTILVVTHNMQQASRISDYTAFMYLGKLVEFSPTEQLFINPRERLTEEYISGRFG